MDEVRRHAQGVGDQHPEHVAMAHDGYQRPWLCMAVPQLLQLSQGPTQHLGHGLAPRNPAATAEFVESAPAGQLIQFGDSLAGPAPEIDLIEPGCRLYF